MSILAGAHKTAFRAAPGTVPLVALLGAAIVLGGVVASLLHLDRFPLPMCVFKAVTGVPCLTCGATRALVRLAHFDALGALAMNPLVALGALAMVPWAVADAALALRGRTLVLDVGPALGRLLRWSVLPLVLANWAFLIAAGR